MLWIPIAVSHGTTTDRTLMLTAALAFPPAWQLVLYGQTSAVILLSFFLAWIALMTSPAVCCRPCMVAAVDQASVRRLPLPRLFLLAREWRIIAGAIVGSAVQWAAVFCVVGAFSGAGVSGDGAKHPWRSYSPRARRLQAAQHRRRDPIGGGRCNGRFGPR
jgi:hypothetical protein